MGNFELRDYAAGAVIMQQGARGDEFFVVSSGNCDVFIRGSDAPVASPCAGQAFGELALLYNTPRAATVTARTAVRAWRLARAEYRLVLAHGAAQRSATYSALLEDVVLKSSSGREKRLRDALTPDQVRKLADCMDEDTVPAGADVVTEGEEGHTFYVILSGSVDIFQRGVKVNLKPLGRGDYFGERALVTDEKRAATCTAVGGPVVVLAVDRDDFINLLGEIDALVENDRDHVSDAEHKQAELEDEDVQHCDLVAVRTLGQGAFGRVVLVRHKVTGLHYALKQQSTAAIVENALEEHVTMERDILAQLDHPFIIKLVGSYQTTKYVFFVLELLIGGELFTHLRKLRTLPEPAMRFYVAGVVLGFEHMHAKKVAYRDLKPENLVLDAKGYCKIVDLGLAKKVATKTWTLCGTPDYLAPEIILNEGHDCAVDYWALGVLMFELCAGMPPFYADDPMQSYEKILSGTMKCPPHFRKYLQDCIRKLLKLCQAKRLGNGKGGCAAIKKHKFFGGFAWEDLLAKNADKLKPPIDVGVAGAGDAHNFDKYDEEDDNLVPAVAFNQLLEGVKFVEA
ncbi:kinase-like domain-containing protein [Pelagophyceae sp. CCMP2097]|nr:kinase-like domain-containing protein [Pelagophyceae sp. CCMP2097]